MYSNAFSSTVLARPFHPANTSKSKQHGVIAKLGVAALPRLEELLDLQELLSFGHGPWLTERMRKRRMLGTGEYVMCTNFFPLLYIDMQYAPN